MPKLFVYSMHSYITHAHLTLDYEILSKKKSIFLCIIHIDFLEFVGTKFNQNLAFVQLFIYLFWLKIRVYTVYFIS